VDAERLYSLSSSLIWFESSSRKGVKTPSSESFLLGRVDVAGNAACENSGFVFFVFLRSRVRNLSNSNLLYLSFGLPSFESFRAPGKFSRRYAHGSMKQKIHR
jgi:hypothetical protein